MVLLEKFREKSPFISRKMALNEEASGSPGFSYTKKTMLNRG